MWINGKLSPKPEAWVRSGHERSCRLLYLSRGWGMCLELWMISAWGHLSEVDAPLGHVWVIYPSFPSFNYHIADACGHGWGLNDLSLTRSFVRGGFWVTSIYHSWWRHVARGYNDLSTDEDARSCPSLLRYVVGAGPKIISAHSSGTCDLSEDAHN